MAPFWPPRGLFESDSNNGSPGHSNLVSDEVDISVQVSYLIFWWLHSDVSKQLDSSAPARNTGHVDVVGSVNTVRLRRYRWSTSKD